MDRQTDQPTPQAPTQPKEHRGGNHLAKNHWWWWQRPGRRKSKASGRVLDGQAQSTALSHHSQTHRHTPLYLYPHVHLNSAYSTDVIAYANICLLLNFDTNSHHACHIKLRQENECFSSYQRKKKFITCTNSTQKKKLVLPHRAVPPSKPKSYPSQPGAPLALTGTGDWCHRSGDERRRQWVGGWAVGFHHTQAAAPRSYPLFWKSPTDCTAVALNSAPGTCGHDQEF